MKVTNFVLINLMNTLGVYCNKKLPQKISYAITRNMMSISKEYSIYEKQLNLIFANYKSHMIKNENGDIEVNQNGIPIVDDDIKDEFDEQIIDLLNIEINLDMFYIDQDFFNYDDKGIYDVLSAQDIIVLQSVLCESKNGVE